MVGHWYGGLGLAAVVACALFAAVSGSSPATVVAIGSIVLPAMVAQGFPKRFGAGIVATSGALGILIPPSIVMVLFAVATGGSVALDPEGKRVLSASVGQLFIAGVIPGLMLASLLFATTFYRAWKNNYPRLAKASWLERARAFSDSFWGLMLIVVVLGGIYSGAFTPTEAAAMSAVYAFVIAVFVYRDMKLTDVPKVLLASANMSAMILYIITNAVLFSFLMTHEQIPQAMTEWITSSGLTWIEFLLIVNLLLLVAGNVMEPSSIVLITAPILFPIAVKLGIHPVHLGILMTVNMEIGLCHPPVGLQSLCRVRHRQDGHHRTHRRRMAVAAHHARLPDHCDLRPGDFALAAARTRDALARNAQRRAAVAAEATAASARGSPRAISATAASTHRPMQA